MVLYRFMFTVLVAVAWEVMAEPQTLPSPTTVVNSTLHMNGADLKHNGSHPDNQSRISSLLQYLPALKNIVICICVLTAVLITCLVIKVIRSGRRLRKTRKYDIITTPGERVEMAPLNGENEDEEDSTLFDIKYR
ncbi:hypothetical protein DPEC_G00167560 [Dallia pectoralis]|uniref:Uncharacterized protein n=1 Tax=Dallia pectoralis TaxID=75939 RepID=A0ACC2GHV0_DALPE|nr:hypothetical protein DPEC_G00167560 [Dallia pectoralis]